MTEPTTTPELSAVQRADQLARVLTVLLGEFRPAPGTRQATAVIDTDTLHRWQNLLEQEQHHA